ncbi:uncharacterized protein Cipc [Centruroides vittatus]|uniref:uncharacterized protein Cipc n=1 Tax=Centruroides vittatus TaxID=120091 RepID=UPI003510C743
MSNKSADEGKSGHKQNNEICELGTELPSGIEKTDVKEVQINDESENLPVENEENHTRKKIISENLCNPHIINDKANFSKTGEDATDQHGSLNSPDLNNLKMVLKKRAFSLPEDISLEKLDCCDFSYPIAKRTKQQISCKVNDVNSENIPPETAHQKKTSLQRASEMLHRNNLMQVTLRTIALIKRNQQLQKELDKLKVEVAQFLQSVVSNPENNFSQRKENQ